MGLRMFKNAYRWFKLLFLKNLSDVLCEISVVEVSYWKVDHTKLLEILLYALT
jgi:hypothetical protein